MTQFEKDQTRLGSSSFNTVLVTSVMSSLNSFLARFNTLLILLILFVLIFSRLILI